MNQKSIILFGKGCLILGGILVWLSQGRVLAQDQSGALEDIRDIMVKQPPGSIVPVVLSIIVLVAVLVIGLLMLRQFISRDQAPIGPSPEMIARKRLDDISSQVEELPPNKASLEASEAVKDFLTAQYSDPIRYETAEEYLKRITSLEDAGSKLSVSLTDEVRSFISISQELKFAQLREAQSRVPSLLSQAEAIIGKSVEESASIGAIKGRIR